MYKYISKYLVKQKKQIIKLLILSLLFSITSILTPYLNGTFLDILITQKNLETIVRFAIILILVGLVDVLVSYFSNIISAKLQMNISYKVNVDIIKHIQRTPYLIISRFDPSYLNQRINIDSNNITSFFLNNITSFFLKAATAIFCFIMLFSINATLFIITLVFLPLYIVLYALLKKPLFKVNLKFKESQNNYFNKLNQQFEQIKDIKTFATFQKSENQIDFQFLSLLKSFNNWSRLSYFFSSLDNIISLIFQSIILLVGATQIIEGKITIGQFTIINSYFGMLLNSIKYYLDFGKSYQESRVSYTRIKELYDINIELNGTMQINRISAITASNIKFDYIQNSSNLLINGFTHTFTNGKIYLLYGMNGSGKSTLINILLGIYQDNSAGEILYNDINLKEIDHYYIRLNKVSVMQQNPIFIKESVIDYVSDCSEFITEETIRAIINRYQIQNLFINASFDIFTYLDKDISELSGGEKQKISFLKAILKNPDVIIMDEPSSAIDQESIPHFINAVNNIKSDKIILLISHDKDINDIADELIKLGN